MRVMGVMGSPRRGGNTDVLVSQALAGAADAGARTELMRLAGREIAECDGCLTCWKGQPCPKGDDMNGIYREIAESQAFVFGTPVYWFGPTALLKAFVDRFVYFNCPENRPLVRGKPAAIVVPFEETDPAMADLVVAFFERSLAYLEMPLAGQVIVPGVNSRGEVADRSEAMEAAYELGRKLVR